MTDANKAMMDPLQRRLAREMRDNGGNEFNARITLIGELQDRKKRIRKTPMASLRHMIADALIFALWEPIIPRMKEIGAEWGIEIDGRALRPPGG